MNLFAPLTALETALRNQLVPWSSVNPRAVNREVDRLMHLL